MAGLTLIHGQAVDARGQPVAAARISWAAGPSAVPLPDVMLLTDSAGRFTLAAPVPGDYTLRCDSDGAGSASVAVHAAGRPLQVVLTLPG